MTDTQRLKNEIKKLKAEVARLQAERPKRVIIPDINDPMPRLNEFVDRMLDPTLTSETRDLVVLAYNLALTHEHIEHEDSNGSVIGYAFEYV